jgi:hypothetical protein
MIHQPFDPRYSPGRRAFTRGCRARCFRNLPGFSFSRIPLFGGCLRVIR